VLIRLKKIQDGVILACHRKADDAEIQRTGHGGFFGPHDLLHYAVETTLGYTEGFFGLVSSGWSFKNFTRHDDPNYRSPPSQAIVAENIVAAFFMHLPDASPGDPEVLNILTEEINGDLAACLSAGKPPILTADQVAAIYLGFEELRRQWAAVPMDGHLELLFEDCPRE
jgi:hypothetical protein